MWVFGCGFYGHLSKARKETRSLEIEGKGDDTAASTVDTACIFMLIFVLDIILIILVEPIRKGIHKLQFRAQLKERKIEIASDTYLKEHFCRFHSDIIIRLCR